MSASCENLVASLKQITSKTATQDRKTSLQAIAASIRNHGAYRWVGLYDVDNAAGMVANVAWSGTGPPEFLSFPVTHGLTGAAVAQKQIVNVGEVSADPRYLTAFPSTRSEVIVPIFDCEGEDVVGTIDIESEQSHAFTAEVERLLQACSEVIRPLWALCCGKDESVD